MSIEARDLTPRQQQMVSAALDAAAAALDSGEWPDLPGYPTEGSVAPILVHLAGAIGSAKRVTYYVGYGEDA